MRARRVINAFTSFPSLPLRINLSPFDAREDLNVTNAMQSDLDAYYWWMRRMGIGEIPPPTIGEIPLLVPHPVILRTVI